MEIEDLEKFLNKVTGTKWVLQKPLKGMPRKILDDHYAMLYTQEEIEEKILPFICFKWLEDNREKINQLNKTLPLKQSIIEFVVNRKHVCEYNEYEWWKEDEDIKCVTCNLSLAEKESKND